MTSVFVYEYLCGGGMRPTGEGSWAATLYAEGRAMLHSMLCDIDRVPGVETATVLDERLKGYGPLAGRRDLKWVRPGEDEPAFRTAARNADWTLVIAPEFHRILETRCRWVLEGGGKLLNPPPEVVALTADKLALARFLELAGVPTPETHPGESLHPPLPPLPWVVKPRFGAGSLETRLIDGQTKFSTSPGHVGETIIQSFVPGQAASVSFLIGPKRAITLAPTAQTLSTDGQFRYLGGYVPLPDPLATRARRIAQLAVAAVPGLFGYVGVDVVLGDRDWVIEINPRLTTSYIGLRAATRDNLAEFLLRTVQGEQCREPTWVDFGERTWVHWTADGTTELATAV